MRPPVLVALVLVALSSCRCESDAERAAKERAEIEEKVRDSLVLFPYRTVKAMMRSEGDPKRPVAFQELEAILDETRALPEKAQSADEQKKIFETYARLFVSLVKTRETLQDVDEDDFPTLLERGEGGRPWRWYDDAAEHQLLAIAWTVLDLGGQKGHLPTADFIWYELSRASPQPSWPFELRALSRLWRGVAFSVKEYRYAAEEELDAYLGDVGDAKHEPLVLANGTTVTSDEVHAGLLAAGHFARAYNRMGLGRDDPATDDVEAGLQELEKLKVDNELTWWAWAFVHAKRERFEESARYLDRLAQSPHIEAGERAELQRFAGEMREGKGVFSKVKQARAAFILVQALVARAGGLENILVTLVGREQADQILSPVRFLDRLRRGLEDAASPERLKERAGGLTKDLGRKGEDLGRGLLEKAKETAKDAAKDAPR